MNENFDEQIEQKQTQIIGLKEQMEKNRLEFVQATVPLIAEFYLPKAKNIIEDDMERSSKLDDKQLDSIKTRVRELVNNAGETANKFLSNPQIWWHMNEDRSLSYKYDKHYRHLPVDKAIRFGLGLLAPVMEEFGFLHHSKEKAEYDIWREWDQSGNRKIMNGQPYYPHNFDWSEGMINPMNSYNERVTEAKKLVSEIETLEAEKKKTQVLNRWDAI